MLETVGHLRICFCLEVRAGPRWRNKLGIQFYFLAAALLDRSNNCVANFVVWDFPENVAFVKAHFLILHAAKM